MADFAAALALGEGLTLVGDLRFTQTGPRQFSTFSYDKAWIENPRAFALQPDLPVKSGEFHTSAQQSSPRDALPGAFADAAPDSWGRMLLERTHGGGLSEFEYLTLPDGSRSHPNRYPAAGVNIIAKYRVMTYPTKVACVG